MPAVVNSANAVKPTVRFDYSNPTKTCDIIMKGGITSGVVYPLAVCELAQTYRFKSIGGTSAGAIAASATAAAELGRYRGSFRGFKGLEELPLFLGKISANSGHSNLFSLFQPQPATKPIFKILTAGLGKSGLTALLSTLGTGLRYLPLPALIGALPGLVLVGLLLYSGTGWLLGWGLGCALLLILLGAVLGIGFILVRRALQVIPNNFYGLCSGYQPDESTASPPLTTWLANLLDTLALNKNPDKPLTFGDLWGDQPGTKWIDLQMMTTNLTHGRPYRLPFEKRIFYFKRDEFERLFPKRVVEWMVNSTKDRDNWDKYAPYYQIPKPEDFPVVVAARLSLSFPFLISAIPLYAFDYSRKDGGSEPERCWFSDGGITSNFPIHFFDKPLPGCPTFGINLRPFHPDYPRDPQNEANNSWMPVNNNDAIHVSWDRFDQVPDSRKLGSFLGAILDTMQSWLDNAQLVVPGYRDRVVHVYLDRNEGGLNLNMPEPLIKALGERGRFAAAKLVDCYTRPAVAGKISWENHRWVRYRTTMAMLEEMLIEVQKRYEEKEYAVLFEQQLSYIFRDENQRDFARAATDKLMELVALWARRRDVDKEKTFRDGAPSPPPELQIRPRT